MLGAGLRPPLHTLKRHVVIHRHPTGALDTSAVGGYMQLSGLQPSRWL
jgi:hypothetical protein